IRCGYNLRGQDEKSRCPECGLATFWSLRAPEKLSHYPPSWIAAMSFAVRLLMIAYAGVFLTLVGGSLGIAPAREQLLIAVFTIAAVLQLVGTWMLSRSSGHWSEPVA